MKKRVAIFAAILLVLAGAYDFWRGYHETRSVSGGIVFVALGLLVLALFAWLMRPRAN